MKEQIVKVRDIEVLEKLFEGYEDIISPSDKVEENTEEDEADFIRDIMSKNGLSFPFKVVKVKRHYLENCREIPAGSEIIILGKSCGNGEFMAPNNPNIFDSKSWKLVR